MKTHLQPHIQPQTVTTNNNYKAVCFHDGDCPLCKIEIKAMQKIDKSNAIHWVDITKDKQALADAGISYQDAMDRIHVIDDQNQMLTGVKGFLAVWQYLPYYRRLVPVIQKVPFLLSIMEAGYRLFARYRLVLTGRTLRQGATK